MVGIVIVNYNGEKFQNECISSLLNSIYKDFKIIIVDNGSTDNSMSKLEEFKTDKIIRLTLIKFPPIVAFENNKKIYKK